ncbi:MAG: hypothetical protein M3Q96_01910 [Pseudomonadota bacterium]|nr:hypothetical protein [Pseudomonadota bacterium]
MIEFLAQAIVVLTGVYFIVLAGASLLAPAHATRFLLGFAGSASAHYMELFLRFLIAGAFLLHAPGMAFPRVFSGFGWVLVVTTSCLLLVPWRWHQRFAGYVVPRAIRYIPLIGVTSLLIGSLILAAVIRGSAA